MLPHRRLARHRPRVPALWIADRAPHLGWCWENNHHTWLGVASAETRITAGSLSLARSAPPSLGAMSFLRRQAVTAALTANAIRPVPGFRAGVTAFFPAG